MDCAPLSGQIYAQPSSSHAPEGTHVELSGRIRASDRGERSRRCSSLCFSTPMTERRSGWYSTTTPPKTGGKVRQGQSGSSRWGYCDFNGYLPHLSIICGDYLLAARLRRAVIERHAPAPCEEVDRLPSGRLRARRHRP